MMDFEDRMIEAVERGECSEDEAYDYVRDSLADAADRQRQERKTRPRPDFDPRIDYPERYGSKEP